MNKDKVILHVRNRHGIRMGRCCMSCAYKMCTKEQKLRRCALDGIVHRRCHVCHDWEMSRAMQGAGASGGLIKKREYLMYILAIRVEEQKSLTPNPSPVGEGNLSVGEGNIKQIERKSVEEIREEFEKEHDSIYLRF